MASSMATAASIPAASVSLHPLASRDGQHSSTIVSVQVPQGNIQRDGLPPLEEIQASLDAPMMCDSSPASIAQHPSTPRKFAAGGFNAQSHDQAYETEGAAGWNNGGPQQDDRVWGIQHEDISQYPVIDDQPAMCTCIEEDNFPSIFSVEDAPPIRAMTAAQLNELHKQYLSLDVPHSVVFPFLHGTDGSNAAQNHFFKAPPTGQPSPNYRGLTIVRADLPTPAQQDRLEARRKRTSSTGSKLSMAGHSSQMSHANHHSRADSMTNSSISSHSAISSDCGKPSSDSNHGANGFGSPSPNCKSASQSNGHAALPLSATGSSASISSSMGSSETSDDSLFSHDHHDGRFGSHTSFETGPTDCDEDMSSFSAGAHNKTPSRMSPSQPYEPQPEACMLTSTLLPYELIEPPFMVNRRNSTCYHARPSTRPRRFDTAMIHTAHFINPKQAAGVNLRNFKIQAVKYAMISDIVIYCPAGYHDGLLTFARWFRDAHEGAYDTRCENGLGGLRYNVFIVTEPFEVFEQQHPQLVAIDRAGLSRNRVDFIERERDEMQRLTTATAIDDNVWLGCTGDLPAFDPNVSSPGSHVAHWQSGAEVYSIAIEFHDQGETPDAAKLLQASQYLDSHRPGDTVWDGHGKDYLNGTGDDSCFSDGSESRASSPGLAVSANGWPGSGNGTGKALAASRSQLHLPIAATGLAAADTILAPPEGNVFHLESHSFTTDLNRHPGQAEVNEHKKKVERGKKVDSVIRLCAWIQAQAQPWKTPLQASAAGSGHGLFAGALKSVQYSRQNSSGSFGRSSTRNGHRDGASTGSNPSLHRQTGRRILLHCGDGYTETSIMALSYMMYSKGLSLPDAYLDLQNRANRSFFVYNRDLPLLKDIEKHIHALRRESSQENTNDNGSRARSKHSFPWLGNEEGSGKRRNASCASPRRNSASSVGPEVAEHNSWMRGLVGWVGAGHKRSTPTAMATPDSLPAPPSRTVTPTPASMASQSSSSGNPNSEGSTGMATPAPGSDAPHAWFHSARFEGSFPSRILPFLYLGNLNHALNAAMLHALGITHVVSVGESALHPPAVSASAVASSSGGQAALPSPTDEESFNSLWHEEQAGRISVLDLKNVSDDGIDPLRSTMRRAVEYIEAARRSGGKVLVHCRVGVSRSTTIVLAYVMAHLDLTLVESYLLVRSRRLSILIQPHLLFFWELRGWESYVASQKLKRRLASEAASSSQPDLRDTSAVLADAHFSLAGLSLHGDPRGEIMDRISSVGSSCGFGAARSSSSSPTSEDGVQEDLDVDIGAGAGSPYGKRIIDVDQVPFGSGSLSDVPAEALRLNWGFLCREITCLNERYF